MSLVHWDSKLMSTLDGAGTEERVPVLLSGVGGTKLLGVPALPADVPMGQAIAQVTSEALQQWQAQDTVAGMVFDTTSSNTGDYCFIIHLIICYCIVSCTVYCIYLNINGVNLR